MKPLLAFQLRRVGRNRQFLFFTVLLPAAFTVFFTKIFGGQVGSGQVEESHRPQGGRGEGDHYRVRPGGEQVRAAALRPAAPDRRVDPARRAGRSWPRA